MADGRPLKRARVAAAPPSRLTAAKPAPRRPSDKSTISLPPQQQSQQQEPSAADSSTIAVFVRCRSILPSDSPEAAIVVKPDSSVRGSTVTVAATNSTKTFSFGQGRVYGSDADQGMLYLDIAKPVIAEAIRGYNCTVFAYGQTGSGKTYTMEGDLAAANGTFADGAGLVPRILYALFHTLSKNGSDFTISCSYLEIYNDTLRDLSVPTTASNDATLRIVDDKSGAVAVQGLEEVYVQSAEQGVELLRRGSQRRQTASTSCNESSSRSHALFTISVVVQDGGEGGKEDVVRTGKINLVDLAGSENVGRSGVQGSHAREAGQINSSLLALGRVINALADTRTASTHIPYRESKLTRILQDSLGGRAKTFIVATLCPFDAEESLSTLDYANRASTIKNRPEANKRISKSALLANYGAELDRLKREVYAARQKDGVYLPLDDFKAAQAAREEDKARLKDALRTNELLESKLSTLEARFEQSAFLLSETVVNLEEAKAMFDDEQAGRLAVQQDFAQAQAENAELFSQNEQLSSTLVDRESKIMALEMDVAALRNLSSQTTEQILGACQEVQKVIKGDADSSRRGFQSTLSAALQALQDTQNALAGVAQTLGQQADELKGRNLTSEFDNCSDRLKKASSEVSAMQKRMMDVAISHTTETLSTVKETATQVQQRLKSVQEVMLFTLRAAQGEGARVVEREQKISEVLDTLVAQISNLFDGRETTRAEDTAKILRYYDEKAMHREAALLSQISTHFAHERAAFTEMSERMSLCQNTHIGMLRRDLSAQLQATVKEVNQGAKAAFDSTKFAVKFVSDGRQALEKDVSRIVKHLQECNASLVYSRDENMTATTEVAARIADSSDAISQVGRDMAKIATDIESRNAANIDAISQLGQSTAQAIATDLGQHTTTITRSAAAVTEQADACIDKLEAHQTALLTLTQREVPPPTPFESVRPLPSIDSAIVPATTTASSPETGASSRRRASSQSKPVTKARTSKGTAGVLRPVDANRRSDDSTTVDGAAKKRKLSVAAAPTKLV